MLKRPQFQRRYIQLVCEPIDGFSRHGPWTRSVRRVGKRHGQNVRAGSRCSPRTRRIEVPRTVIRQPSLDPFGPRGKLRTRVGGGSARSRVGAGSAGAAVPAAPTGARAGQAECSAR
jgi:hypothetical protein